jgi:transcription antitermination protein NusB
VRARTKARKRALDILFESEAKGVDPLEVLSQRRDTDDAPPVSDYAAQLVEGVTEHLERIDQLLAEHAEGWTVARMPAVDRALLRIGLYELLWMDEIDDPVAITEAVELAKSLSTDDSPKFVNGVLGRISDIAEHLRPSTPS